MKYLQVIIVKSNWEPLAIHLKKACVLATSLCYERQPDFWPCAWDRADKALVNSIFNLVHDFDTTHDDIFSSLRH
jgi:hypothetical protein